MYAKVAGAIIGWLVVAGLLLGSQVSASIVLTPDEMPQIAHVFENSAFDSADMEAITGVAMLDMLFKHDRDTNSLSGTYAGSYSSVLGANDGVITHNGGVDYITCPTCFLVVKNGKFGGQYIFDMNAWDGLETLELNGFFASTNGSISHVAIWGVVTAVAVSEPGAAFLLLSGLAGLFASRRQMKKGSSSHV
ncbi:hypothetical protein ACFOSD_03420 [Salinispirillum marinum]|uniref:PEP-CTERM protein-sorting domain-containing protein n=2 Tax=Saccharospirillaceae TaxID=255527 RepID=A0ABV8BDT8_9GAMM